MEDEIQLKKTKSGAQQYIRGKSSSERMETARKSDPFRKKILSEDYEGIDSITEEDRKARDMLRRAWEDEVSQKKFDEEQKDMRRGYAKGGMVKGKRGCGKAMKGYGKGKMY